LKPFSATRVASRKRIFPQSTRGDLFRPQSKLWRWQSAAELTMFEDVGIGLTEVVVFLVIAGFVWGLVALASITKTRP
jgi:hypothetical protein